MAVATYTTDLTDINIVNQSGGTTNWTAIGSGQAGLVSETDFFIQGDGCLSKAGWSAAVKGLIYNNTTGITVATDNAVFMWIYMWAPNAMSNLASGGLQFLIGSGTGAYKQWYVSGSDHNPYGGWLCFPVDPTVTADATTGSPSGTLQYFGAQSNLTGSVSKGQPIGVDAFRHGRSIIILNGESGAYGTFAAAATTNDSTSNRWGLFQQTSAGFLQQGRFQMGSSGTLVDFRDSNRNIVIANTTKVVAGFNLFEVRNASSNIQWTNISIKALGTVAKGNFICTDNATVAITDCSFTDMGTFSPQSSTTFTNTTFRNCALITANNATFNSCSLIGTSDSVKAVIIADPSKISNTEFTSSGTKHAIELTTTGEYNFTGNTFSGYSGTSTNAAIYNNSGGSITLNILGGGDTPSVRNGSGASTTIQNSVNLVVGGLVAGSRVYIRNTTDSIDLFNQTEATSTFSQSYAYAGDKNILVRVRKATSGTKYKTWETTGTITSTGFTTTANQIVDE
jgi:hypothetical protein